MLILGLVARPAMAACSAPEVEVIAAVAVDAVVDDDYDQVRGTVETALSSLECLEQVVSAEALATLWQAKAAMAFFGGEMEAVLPGLKQAAAVHPQFFESRLGRDLRVLWEKEVEQDPGVASVRVESSRGRQVLWVNGLVRSGRSTELRPGIHLVQVVEDDHVVLTRVLELRPGETASLKVEDGRVALPDSVLRGIELGAAGGAVAAWTVAVVLDRRSYRADTVRAHDRLWRSARCSAGVAVGLAGTAVFSFGLRHSWSFQ